MTIFSDLNNDYKILDYSISHNQLLIRSMRNKGKHHNIDIIFKGVSAMLIPCMLKGLEITSVEIQDDNKFLLGIDGFKTTRDYKLYSLKNSAEVFYYVNAMCFGVFHNTLDILETSLGRYDMENFGESVLWYPTETN
jgi:hypothetical protein